MIRLLRFLFAPGARVIEPDIAQLERDLSDRLTRRREARLKAPTPGAKGWATRRINAQH